MIKKVLLAGVLIAPLVGSTAAHAGIPIPCTATRFLKASDLTGITDLNGQSASPYYNVFGCAAGKWDGYLAADGKYMKLDALPPSKLPPAPTFWTAAMRHPGKFWVEWLWIVVGFFVVVGTALASFAGVDPSSNTSRPLPQSRPRRS